MGRTRVVLGLAVVLSTACNDVPTAPRVDAPMRQTAAAVSRGSNAVTEAAVPPAIQALLDGAFTFLEPLPGTDAAGDFDSTLLDALSVVVCELPACDAAMEQTYTSVTGSASGTLRLDDLAGHYIVNWKPSRLGMRSPDVYRVSVRAGSLRLGHLDVQLVTSASQISDAGSAGAIALVENSTLPVKFSVRSNPVVSASALAGSAAPVTVAAMLESRFGLDAGTTAAILAFVGYPAFEVATAMREAFALTAAQAAVVLEQAGLASGPAQVTAVLHAGGYPLFDILTLLRDQYGQSAADAAATGFAASIAASDVGSALMTVFGAALEDAARDLRTAGFPLADVGAWILAQSEPADPTGAAGVLRLAGYGIDEVAGFLESTGLAGMEDIAAALVGAGFLVQEIADWLIEAEGLPAGAAAAALRALGQPVSDAGAWLLSRELTDAEAALALSEGGFTIPEVGSFLAHIGRSAQEAAPILRDIGATAFDVSEALITFFAQDLDDVALLLQANGFDGGAAFDAVYRAGREVLDDPPAFALNVALAAMNGAGYTLDAFRDGLIGSAHEWTQENLVDALGLSGFAMGDLVPFMMDVLGMSVDHVMQNAESWGVPLSDIAGALVDAGALAADIATGAMSVYEASAADVARTLADAGATAIEIADALVDVYDQSLAEVGILLDQAGFVAQVVFDALYRTGTELLGNPPEFALRVALAAMKGAGFALDDFRDALVGGAREWTQEHLIDALGLSGFGFAELGSFLVNTLGLTAQRVAQLAHSWGVPVDEFAAGMRAAGLGVEAFAGTMMDVFGMTADASAAVLKRAGYTAAEAGDWLVTRLGAGMEAIRSAARALAGAGFDFDEVAAWIWIKSDGVAASAAPIFQFAGYNARRVTGFLLNVGTRAESAFRALEGAGYAAADAAEALHLEAGVPFPLIGAWLADAYGLAAQATLDILHGLGASLPDLIGVVLNVFHATLDVATALLTTYGFSAADIILGWPVG